MLRDFCARWAETRPADGGRFNGRDGRRAGQVVTAVAWLAAETRTLDPAGRGVEPRTIQTVRRARWQTTELRVADALVAALGRPEAFYDGTLEVRPNPMAAPAVRARCCSGSSLTGVA